MTLVDKVTFSTFQKYVSIIVHSNIMRHKIQISFTKIENKINFCDSLEKKKNLQKNNYCSPPNIARTW